MRPSPVRHGSLIGPKRWLVRSARFFALIVIVLTSVVRWDACLVAAATDGASATSLVVRLYNGAGWPDGDPIAAIRSASEILLASGVPAIWLECGSHEPPAAPDAFVCNRPLTRREIAIRLLRDVVPIHGTAWLPLGYSLIDASRHEGALATVYLDRVERVAADSGVAAHLILGRAIAHEIGHLLLGTSDHSKGGLMRAFWSRQTLEENRPDDWLFSPRERAGLQRAIGLRVPLIRAAEDATTGH